jgi:hypothetical protein
MKKVCLTQGLSLRNNSDLDLTDKNWALFFNMAPRPILENKTRQPADIRTSMVTGISCTE